MKNPFASLFKKKPAVEDGGEGGAEAETEGSDEEETAVVRSGGYAKPVIGGVLLLLLVLAGGVAYVMLAAPAPQTASVTSNALSIPAPGQTARTGDAGPSTPTDSGLRPPTSDTGTGDAEPLEPAAVAGTQTVAVAPTAFDGTPKLPVAESLDTRPFTELIEPSNDGPLPRISSDGRQPWKIYARPFDQRDDRPRVAVIVAGLGLSTAATQAAIDRLPAAVSLAFSPYADDLDQWIPKARNAGHEVFLGLPMEPFDFPRSDPGPLGLLKKVRPAENITRLYKILGKASAYVGLITTMGSEFSTSESYVKPVVEVLLQRGLMVVDSKTSPDSKVSLIAGQIGAARASVDVEIDRDPSRTAIGTALIELETTARDQAVALGVAAALPATVERVNRWAAGLEDRNVALVPVSAIANRQFGR